MNRRVIVTGAPGTGKTTLLGSLTHLGVVVPEPAREVIAEHRQSTGESSLDHRPELFLDRLLARSISAFDSVAESSLVLFDRGLPDCVTYAEIFGLDTEPARRAAFERRYENTVFICPPWREIYTTDDLRRATFQQVEDFHESLMKAYASLGYQLIEVPRSPSTERVGFVEVALDS